MSKIKNGGLDQYGAEPFKQQQFGPAGAEGVNNISHHSCFISSRDTYICVYLFIVHLTS